MQCIYYVVCEYGGISRLNLRIAFSWVFSYGGNIVVEISVSEFYEWGNFLGGKFMKTDLPAIVCCFGLGLLVGGLAINARKEREKIKAPTEVQVRIHEGIMDSYAERNVNPFHDFINKRGEK